MILNDPELRLRSARVESFLRPLQRAHREPNHKITLVKGLVVAKLSMAGMIQVPIVHS